VTQGFVSTYLKDLHFNQALILWKIHRITWKRPLGRPRHICENGIRVWILNEQVWRIESGFFMSRPVVKTVMNFQVAINDWDCLG
jgi:hypothetical protein